MEKIKVPTPTDRQAAKYVRDKTFDFIVDALNGKIEREVAAKLSDMIINLENTDYDTSNDTDFESRAADREAARNLAKYIADNYFDDPKEAQAFVEEINKRIEESELIDKGYVLSIDARHAKIAKYAAYNHFDDPKEAQAFLINNGYVLSSDKELVKPEHPDDLDKWFEKNGYTDLYYELCSKNYMYYLGFVDSFDKEADTTIVNLREKMYEEVIDFKRKHPAESSAEPVLFWNSTWEDIKKANCDYTSMYSEEYKTWYADYEANAKEIATQKAIDNAKNITDFSSNEKWNTAMSLLPAIA